MILQEIMTITTMIIQILIGRKKERFTFLFLHYEKKSVILTTYFVKRRKP